MRIIGLPVARLVSVFICSSRTHRDLHSFPTRRSSDLCPTVLSRAPDHCRRAIRCGRADRRSRAHSRADRKSTRLNSSHANISYAVFCLKKKTLVSEADLNEYPSWLAIAVTEAMHHFIT